MSVITVGEIEKGLVLGEQRALDMKRQRHFFEIELPAKFGHRILAFDGRCAKRWGSLLGALHGDKDAERVLSLDAQIAATAQEHNLTICSRNTRGFYRLGITNVVNPFS